MRSTVTWDHDSAGSPREACISSFGKIGPDDCTVWSAPLGLCGGHGVLCRHTPPEKSRARFGRWHSAHATREAGRVSADGTHPAGTHSSRYESSPRCRDRTQPSHRHHAPAADCFVSVCSRSQGSCLWLIGSMRIAQLLYSNRPCFWKDSPAPGARPPSRHSARSWRPSIISSR